MFRTIIYSYINAMIFFSASIRAEKEIAQEIYNSDHYVSQNFLGFTYYQTVNSSFKNKRIEYYYIQNNSNILHIFCDII